MLMPKKVKHRKVQRGRMKGKAWKGHTVSYGDFGMKVLEPGGSRIARSRQRGSRSLDSSSGAVGSGFGSFPDKPVTKKPQETRMGKGKGSPSFGSPWSSRAEFSTRCRAFPKTWPREPIRLAATSSVEDQSSSRASRRVER